MKPDNSERNARIIEMRKAGKFPREIAKALGVTRNVVIGALHRAGLTDPNVDRSAAYNAALADGHKAAHGANHWRAKLTEQDVADIRWRRLMGSRLIELATAYGVSTATISNAANGKSWAHVQ